MRLRAVDVDLERGILMVQHSKGRTRIVAIRADLVAELRRYVQQRQRMLDEASARRPGRILPAQERVAADRPFGVGCAATAAS